MQVHVLTGTPYITKGTRSQRYAIPHKEYAFIYSYVCYRWTCYLNIILITYSWGFDRFFNRFGWEPGCCVEMKFRKLHFRKKTELRLRWEFDPGPLLFVITDKPLRYTNGPNWNFYARTSFVGLERINRWATLSTVTEWFSRTNLTHLSVKTPCLSGLQEQI